jgi:hypothetical protein
MNFPAVAGLPSGKPDIWAPLGKMLADIDIVEYDLMYHPWNSKNITMLIPSLIFSTLMPSLLISL